MEKAKESKKESKLFTKKELQYIIQVFEDHINYKEDWSNEEERILINNVMLKLVAAGAKRRTTLKEPIQQLNTDYGEITYTEDMAIERLDWESTSIDNY